MVRALPMDARADLAVSPRVITYASISFARHLVLGCHCCSLPRVVAPTRRRPRTVAPTLCEMSTPRFSANSQKVFQRLANSHLLRRHNFKRIHIPCFPPPIIYEFYQITSMTNFCQCHGLSVKLRGNTGARTITQQDYGANFREKRLARLSVALLPKAVLEPFMNRSPECATKLDL